VAVQAYAYAFVSGQDRPKPDLWHWYRAVFANLAIVFTLGRQHSSAGSNRSRAQFSSLRIAVAAVLARSVVPSWGGFDRDSPVG
jgi:hypothetical protein